MNNSPSPSISVVIICYNQAEYIEAGIASVLAQTRQDVIAEIIVVDDGSNDGSDQVIASVAAREPKVVSIRISNSGGAAIPRNTGAERANGDYVAFLDGDDVWEPGKVVAELEAIRRAPEAGLLFCGFAEVDEETGKTHLIRPVAYSVDEPDALGRLFVQGGPILPSCAICKREIFSTVGGFDPAMRFNEDPEFWLRVAARFPLQHIPGVFVRKRIRPGSLGSVKYGRENIAFLKEITHRAVSANPQLSRLLPQREARIALKTALLEMEGRRRLAAARSLLHAISNMPLAPKPWLYLMVLLVPGHPARVLDWLKSAVAKVRRRGLHLDPASDGTAGT